MKSIENAQLWRIPTILLLVTSLSGCASFSIFGGEDVKPIEVVTVAEERTPLNLPDPTPLSAKDIEWVVVTPENIDEIFEKLNKDGQNVVLFALTEDGYQQISVQFAEARNYILQQRLILMKYREYYEPAPQEEEQK